MKKILAAAVLFAAMTACDGVRNDKPLEGTVWKLTSMEGIPAAAIDSEVDAFTLMFDGEEMMAAGRTNCNRFFCNYEAIDGTLAFGEMGMTRMACPDMEFEDAFVQMLGEVDSFSIDGGELTLFSDGQTLASFESIELPQNEEE